MTLHTKNIRRLIKILGQGTTMLIFPIIIWDEHWDGIRLYGNGYELFQIIDIPLEDREQFAGAEEMESILESHRLFEEDEILIQSILEQILIEG